MIVIHEHILQQIKEELGEKGISLCIAKLNHEIDPFITQTIQEELSVRDVVEARAYVFKNRFQKTKKRWFKLLKDSTTKSAKKKTELMKEIEFAKDFLERFNEKKFKELYDANSIDDLIQNILNDVEEWSKNEKKKLIDYKYIEEKTLLQMETALRIDIAMIALNLYTREYDGSTTNIYLELPNQLLSIPTFSVQRGKLNFSEEPLLIDGIEYYAQPYSPTEEFSFMTVVWKQDVDGGKISDKELRTLDGTDEKIYLAVMENRNNIDFIRDRSIYVNVGDIVTKTFGSDNSKNYQAVVTRMNKMAHVKFNLQSENKENIVFGIFDNIQWDREQKTAIVTISDVLQKQIIERQVTLMYRDVVNKLKINMPKTIVFAVQKERLRSHLEGLCKSIFTYDFFVYRLQFKKRSKKANIEIIEDYLNEMKEQQVIIQDYKRIGDQFHVDFIPVMDYEVRDIIQSTNIIDIEEIKSLS